MQTEIKELEINCVNQVKYESHDKFGQSVFSDVYEKAKQYTRQIIKDNQAEENQKEEINNIIPFVGDRGMGKSSAMLSYVRFLKDYRKIVKRNSEFSLGDNELIFYCLPRIDAAMFVKGENLLDIVLANMWREFEGVQPFQEETDEVRQEFIHVKKSYEMYTNQEKTDVSSIRDLKDLSRCMNLANDLKKLMKKFLRLMTEDRDERSFLVITLDDLDTATANVYDVLEQLRLFLMIRGVIILTTVDMGRLRLECNKYFMQKLYVEEVTLSQEIMQIKGYADRYLSKLFPANRRIHMPEMGVDVMRDFKIKFGEKEDTQSIKKLFYTCIYEHTGIMLFPRKRTNKILQYNSLRDIVNELYLLEEISHIENAEDKYERTIQWLMQEMEENLYSIQNENDFYCLKNSIDTQLDYMNNEIAALGKSTFGEYKKITAYAFEYETMVDILYDLSVKQKISGGVFDFVIFLYSIRLSEVKELPVKNIWKDVLETDNATDSLFGIGEKEENKVQQSALEIEWNSNSNDFAEWLDNNAESVYGVFCTALMCDLNLWDSRETDYIEYKLVDRVDQLDLLDMPFEASDWEELYFEAVDRSVEVSIDRYFNNMIRFEECLEGFISNLYAAYQKHQKQEIQNNISYDRFPAAAYSEWKEKYRVKSLNDVFPLESVDVINEITIMMHDLSSLSSEENMTLKVIDKTIRQIHKAEEILKVTDEFYETRYHKIISGYESITKVLENAMRNAKENVQLFG